MLPLLARVDRGAMAIKEYSALIKTPALLEPHLQIFFVSYFGHSMRESYPSAEMQSVYFSAQSDLTDKKSSFKTLDIGNHIHISLKQSR